MSFVARRLAAFSTAIILLAASQGSGGDDLTRENVMRQAANLDFEIGLLLPGVRVRTSPTDYAPIKQLQMMRFVGKRWERFGPIWNDDGSS